MISRLSAAACLFVACLCLAPASAGDLPTIAVERVELSGLAVVDSTTGQVSVIDGGAFRIFQSTIPNGTSLIMLMPRGPQPPEPPTPPQPPSGLDDPFAKLAYEQAMKLPANFKSLAGKLADNYEAEAAQIAAGARSTVDASLAELKANNRLVFTDAQRVGWLDWFVAWQVAANAANSDGSLRTLADYQRVYAATATGLRKVK